MRIYTVGGSVRDMLLGKTPKDRDHVIVDSSPEELRALGFQEVGKRQPVFLHPKTREEYVLTTDLFEDLRRRDLTINAMAIAEDDHTLVDPFNGQEDIKKKVLRHVSGAFEEDPLRVYRVARFKCLMPQFTVALETLRLMEEVARSEVFAKVDTERIFNELRRCFTAMKPSIFFEVLLDVGALKVHFPELLRSSADFSLLDRSARLASEDRVKFACLLRPLTEEEVFALTSRLKVPNAWIEAAISTVRHLPKIISIHALDPRSLTELFYAVDAYRKPHLVEFLAAVAQACGKEEEAEFFKKCFTITEDIGKKDVPSDVTGKELGEAIKVERIKALSTLAQGNSKLEV